MSEENSNNTNNIAIGKREHLIAFSCGDTVRYIKSSGIDNAKDLDDAHGADDFTSFLHKIQHIDMSTSAMVDNDMIAGHYLMKEKNDFSKMNFPKGMFEHSYLDAFEKNATVFKSSVYYDDYHISFEPQSLIHSNDMCYMLQNNEYKIKRKYSFIDVDNNAAYSINSYLNNSNMNAMLSSYVSEKYNENFYVDSQCTSDKSIPIYALNEKALKDLHILKIENKNAFGEFLHDCKITDEEREEILFNTRKWEYDFDDYDSIDIDRFINIVENKNIAIDYARIFEDLLSNVKYDSFYRVLIPIGKMTLSPNGESKDIQEFVVSPSLESKQNDICTNYFSLKNLQNPYNEYDYILRDCPSAISYRSPDYEYSNNMLSISAMQFKQHVTDEFNKLIKSKNATNSYIRWKNENKKNDFAYFVYLSKKYNIRPIDKNLGYSTLTYEDVNAFLDDKIEYNPFYLANLHYSNYNLSDALSLEEIEKLQKKLDPFAVYGIRGIPISIASSLICNSSYYKDNKDYLNAYKSLFSKENAMEVSGSICGNRDYDALLKGTQDSMFFRYKYDIKFDEEFLKNNKKTILKFDFDSSIQRITTDTLDNNENCISSLLEEDSIGILRANDISRLSPKEDEDLTDVISEDSILNYEYYKINDDEYALFRPTLFLSSYFNMLENVSRIDNVEKMKGSYYYKTKDVKKSNIFSLRINNSGLEYDTMNFNETILYIRSLLNSDSYDLNEKCFKVNDKKITLFEAMKMCKIDRLLVDDTVVEYDSNQLNDDTYMYFIYDDLSEIDEKKAIIKNKTYIRRLFENSIRRNITKYIPVEATLWKVEFDGNNK